MKKLAGIALVCLIIAIGITVGHGHNSKLPYQVLSNELSFSLDDTSVFSINPSKVEILKLKFGKTVSIPVVVHNNSGEALQLLIGSRFADYVTEGYSALSPDSPYYLGTGFGSIEVQPASVHWESELPLRNSYTLQIQIGMDSKKIAQTKVVKPTEAWVSVLEVTDAQFRHELCLRILIK